VSKSKIVSANEVEIEVRRLKIELSYMHDAITTFNRKSVLRVWENVKTLFAISPANAHHPLEEIATNYETNICYHKTYFKDLSAMRIRNPNNIWIEVFSTDKNIDYQHEIIPTYNISYGKSSTLIDERHSEYIGSVGIHEKSNIK
jgi:hypothetical protein